MYVKADPEKKRGKKHHYGRGAVIIVFCIVALVIWGIADRIFEGKKLRERTDKQSITNVAVIKAPGMPSVQDIVLPGTVQAFHEAPIYARTSGYVKSWTADIGARVKEGDVLAQIETPEVDAQLHQAQANLGTATANNELAQSTAKRWRALLKTNAVSKQDADDKIGAANAAEATMEAAQANLDRLNELERFKNVVAPFDGTITARDTDNGALINSGNGGVGQELFRIAETARLRIYVEVPESDSAAIKSDLTAKLRFAQYPQKDFVATLAHTADAIDPTTRTLLVELWLDNKDGEVLPGGYAEVHLNVPSATNYVRLPVNTVLFRGDGLHVATVDENSKAVLKSITIGRDYGKDVEITSGVAPNDTIIINPPDSLFNGQQLRLLDQKAKNQAEGSDSNAKSGDKENDEKKLSDADDKKATPEKSDQKKDDADVAGDQGTGVKKEESKILRIFKSAKNKIEGHNAGDDKKKDENADDADDDKDDSDDTVAKGGGQEDRKGPDVDTKGNVKRDDKNQ